MKPVAIFGPAGLSSRRLSTNDLCSLGKPGLAGSPTYLESPGTWPSDNTVLTVEAVLVCLIGWAAESPCRFKCPAYFGL